MIVSRSNVWAWVLSALLFVLCPWSARADTLAQVQARGVLRCGVSTGLPGFSFTDAAGRMRGFDADICRAVAAAVLGDAEKVAFVKLTSKDRFTVLRGGEIDLLSRNTTYTFSREAGLNVMFPAVTLLDGQGFLVPRASNIARPEDLNDATLCTQTGTTAESNLDEYFRARGLKYRLLVFDRIDEALSAYQNKRCDAFTTDLSGLYALRLKLYDADQHVILPQTISQEPFAVAVRPDDVRWARAVAWVVYALLHAETLGITRDNVHERQKNALGASERRLLGRDEDIGAPLGLASDWIVRVVAQTGNYGEIYERHLGALSPLQMPRGGNRSSERGGLLLAPPLR